MRLFRRFNRSLAVFAICTFLFAGCAESSRPGKAANENATPDDQVAVVALENAGCSLKKDAAGLVTAVAVSSDTDFSETLKHLVGVPNITTALGGPGMNDKGMTFLSSLKSLKRLDLTDCSAIGDDTLKVVGAIQTIEVLTLRRAGFTDAGLEPVRNLSKLRAIDLRNTNVTDAGVAHLAGIKTLVDVQLEKSKVTDAGIEYLRGLPLKSLNLNYTAVTDAAMPAIGSITTLESLQMEASRLTDVGMAEVAKLKKLKRFGCRLADVSGEGIKHLAGLKELTRLELRETSIDDISLQIISDLAKLEYLDISECRSLKGKTIGELGKLTGLKYLELRELKKVNDDNFAALGTLTNLTELNLETTRITDESTATLLKMQKLERLSVAGSQMGDEGIVQLGQLPALKWLNLSNSQPKPETVAALKAAKPGIEIFGVNVLPDTSKRTRSESLFERASRVIPGGVNSPAFTGAVGGTPPFMKCGEGAYLFDVDGNRFIDYVGSWGPHLFGHRHPAILQAIEQAASIGTSFGAPTEAEAELAQLVVDMVPSVEMVRMVNSGTEATMSAIRVARGFTGRNGVVKFAGCYHGHVDSLLVAAGSGGLTLGCPSSPGVPPGATADTVVLPYNDCESLEVAFQKNGGQLASVILEPVVGNMGCVIPTPEFLSLLRRLCTQYGTVLIFDEVMTGFQVAAGGAQQLFGITPDMTTLGKIIDGMPVGAYGGRADIMNCVSPVGKVYQAGTLSGNPVAMAAGIAMLKLIREQNPYPRLEQASQKLAVGFQSAASAAGVDVRINRVGSMLTVFLTSQTVTSLASATTSDTARFARWFHGLLNRGVYLPCSQYEAMFVSAVHTDADIDQTIAAAAASFSDCNN